MTNGHSNVMLATLCLDRLGIRHQILRCLGHVLSTVVSGAGFQGDQGRAWLASHCYVRWSYALLLALTPSPGQRRSLLRLSAAVAVQLGNRLCSGLVRNS